MAATSDNDSNDADIRDDDDDFEWDFDDDDDNDTLTTQAATAATATTTTTHSHQGSMACSSSSSSSSMENCMQEQNDPWRLVLTSELRQMMSHTSLSHGLCSDNLVSRLSARMEHGLDESEHQFVRNEFNKEMSALCAADPPCELVSPGKVYIGSVGVSQSLEALRSIGVTHIVVLARECDSVFAGDEFDIDYYRAELDDDDRQDLSAAFKCVTQWILEALAARERNVVYMHCNSGVSRVGALSLAFFMLHRQWPLAKAFEHLKGARARCRPTRHFMKQLVQLERDLFSSVSLDIDALQWPDTVAGADASSYPALDMSIFMQ
jgi:Dual specificity phosphatase, catalytic domain